MVAARDPSQLSGRCIGLVGPFPPPRGGMTLHLQRLAARLQAAGIRVVAMTTAGGDVGPPGVELHRVRDDRTLVAQVARISASRGVELLHFHTFGAGWQAMILWAALRTAAGVPVIVSQHSMLGEVRDLSARDRTLARHCVNRLTRVVASGPSVYAKLLELGAGPERVVQATPFIAPSAAELDGVAFAPEIEAFIASHQPLVASGTGRLVTIDGEDLYGLDVFVRAAAAVVARLPGAGFVYLISQHGDAELLANARAFVRKNGLQDNVCIEICDAPAPALWGRAAICVRPTIDDGDALSVREALALGIPVVASDAVGRPRGCQTYRNRDAADCARAILEVAQDLTAAAAVVARNPPTEGVAELINVYSCALQDRPLRARVLTGVFAAVRSGRPRTTNPGS